MFQASRGTFSETAILSSNMWPMAKIMIRNVGTLERWLRVVGGLILMVLGITLPIPFWVEEVAETIGLLAVVSGAVGYCPVKHLLARARQHESQ
jgi:hypothetical protein